MTIDSNLLTDLRPRLHRYIFKRLRDQHLAEDLLQDVLMKLHAHAADLPHSDERRVMAWALRTAHNAIIDHFRAARRARLLHEQISAQPADRSTSAAPVPQNLVGCARAMVRRLPERYRVAVELADLQQRPQHEVARELGISLTGAKSRVQRGRRQLRVMMDQCCDIELGRRGSVVSVVPTPRAGAYCGQIPDAEDSCVPSSAAPSS